MAATPSSVQHWRDRPIGFWLLHIGLPTVLLAASLTAGYLGGEVARMVLNPQTGIQETVTGLITFASAAIVAVVLARTAGALDWPLKIWLALFIAAMVFFAGEDLNWGQHYFGWTPSDYFLEHNRENETNLHNMWPLLFNRLPRALVTTWLVVACLLVPLGGQFLVRLLRGFVPEVLWPDRRLMFPAGLVFVFKGLRHLSSQSGDANWLLTIRHSEVEELLIACVLLFYALMLRERLKTPAVGA